jgi:hypothetical protein
LATRFHTADGSGARAWTPFYNGGMRVACGVVRRESGPNTEYVQPRSGRCCAQLGYSQTIETEKARSNMYFGAHQAVPVPEGTDAVLVGAWFYVSSDVSPLAVDMDEESRDSMTMAVGWQLDDGTVVDPAFVSLNESSKGLDWQYKCLTVAAPPSRSLRMIHIYFHFQDRRTGAMFVDDVTASPLTPEDRHNQSTCHRALISGDEEVSLRKSSSRLLATTARPLRHLTSTVRPRDMQLTIAVPLTADRILRLESMSKFYGGGPLAAAVLIRSEEEAAMFVHIWKRRPWLFNHVDVTMVSNSQNSMQGGAIPLNALRNLAVRLATTEFILMLDVDMNPATSSFACFRDPEGKLLSGLFTETERRSYAVPVFITDIHVRPALTKSELLNQLHHRVGAAYCINSQRAVKMDKWLRATSPYETRFLTDFEPFGICRRSQHPRYDERFVGYGFNKVAWAWGAEASGVRLHVLSESFVTHLNHMDNEWVSDISVPQYLQTWRRYLAFAAEVVAPHAVMLPTDNS